MRKTLTKTMSMCLALFDLVSGNSVSKLKIEMYNQNWPLDANIRANIRRNAAPLTSLQNVDIVHFDH